MKQLCDAVFQIIFLPIPALIQSASTQKPAPDNSKPSPSPGNINSDAGSSNIRISLVNWQEVFCTEHEGVSNLEKTNPQKHSRSAMHSGALC